MANKYMVRDDAPFGEEIWDKLDSVLMGAASAVLSGRKVLDIEGPFGLGLKSVPLADEMVSEAGVSLISSPVLPVPLLQAEFSLSARDLATYEQTGFALDTSPMARAAIAIASAEDSLVFEGNKAMGISGLTNAKGVGSVKLGSWDDIGTAAKDVISAVSSLDSAGFHGPYELALAPDLYNRLFRLYPQGFQTELQHVEAVIGSSVIKAAGLKGGVLLAPGKQFASIVVGQDMQIGFIGPEGPEFRFKIVESLVPRIRVPESICVLKP